ncbi:hypothetical protein MIR68_004491 [Amoeboaphelidium protococcarum]|nr:hypothetical protein MIR68_004491 [Amoeboaphelidium protococcarum]
MLKLNGVATLLVFQLLVTVSGSAVSKDSRPSALPINAGSALEQDLAAVDSGDVSQLVFQSSPQPQDSDDADIRNRVVDEMDSLPTEDYTLTADPQYIEMSAEEVSVQIGKGIVIDTSLGLVRGKVQRPYDRVRQFLGMPYAKSPSGELRWKAPQQHDGWDGIRDATRLGAQCPQLTYMGHQSEDCLLVDVFTPTKDRMVDGKLLPVMFWIHGGAFLLGSGNMVGVQNPMYMVHHKDVIVVSINYRLGALGFLVTKEVKGNFGLLDQRFAMQWVQENIAAFGGDKNRVTLWGESAGAMSISHHLTMPKSYGLFSRVIMQSPVFGVRCRPLEEAEQIGDLFAKRVGCQPNDMDCMRKVPLIKIAHLRWPIPLHNKERFLADLLLWNPVVDGEEVVDQPLDLMTVGKVAPVPILMGINKHETGFVAAFLDEIFGTLLGRKHPPFYGFMYKLLMQGVFRDASAKVLQLYPSHGKRVDRNLDMLVDATSDYMAVCPVTKVAKALASQQAIYVYSFEYHAKYLPVWFMRRCKSKSVCHAMELPYVFHSLQNNLIVPKFTKEEHTMSHILIDYWTSFAYAQSDSITVASPASYPHDLGGDMGEAIEYPVWPKYSQTMEMIDGVHRQAIQYMEFSANANAVVRTTELRGNYCQLWNQLKHDY